MTMITMSLKNDSSDQLAVAYLPSCMDIYMYTCKQQGGALGVRCT